MINKIRIIHPIGKVCEMNFFRDFFSACGIYSEVYSYFSDSNSNLYESYSIEENREINRTNTMLAFCILDKNTEEEKIRAFNQGYLCIPSIKKTNSSEAYINLLEEILQVLQMYPPYKIFGNQLQKLSEIYFQYDLRHYLSVYNYFSMTNFFQKNPKKSEEFADVLKNAYEASAKIKDENFSSFCFYLSLAESINQIVKIKEGIYEYSNKRLLLEIEKKRLLLETSDYAKMIYLKFKNMSGERPKEKNIENWYIFGENYLKYYLLLKNEKEISKKEQEYINLSFKEPSNRRIIRQIVREICKDKKRMMEAYNNYCSKVLSNYETILSNGILDLFDITLLSSFLEISSNILYAKNRKLHMYDMQTTFLKALEQVPFNSFITQYYNKDQILLSKALYQKIKLEELNKENLENSLYLNEFENVKAEEQNKVHEVYERRRQRFSKQIYRI